MNDIESYKTAETNIVLYADDVCIYVSNETEASAVEVLRRDLSNLSDFFRMNKLSLNTAKTEFIILSKKSKKTVIDSVTVDGCVIPRKDEVKYLGVILDKYLTYSSEVKSVLKKQATSIKTFYTLRRFLDTKMRITVLHSLFFSHLLYPSVLFSSLTQELLNTLEQQLNWAVKALFFRKKFDRSSDLKAKLSIMNVTQAINLRIALFFGKSKTTNFLFSTLSTFQQTSLNRMTD